DIDSTAQAAPMAADYRHPLPVLVDVGSLARTDPGDFDGDGFSEGRGYYVLQLDGSTAKLRVSRRRHVRFSPVFKVINVADREVWVNVDVRLLQVNGDGGGVVRFTVNGEIAGETLVEVTSREKGAP